MVHSIKNCYVIIQHLNPMSSYPGLPLYITVDNCNYQLTNVTGIIIDV